MYFESLNSSTEPIFTQNGSVEKKKPKVNYFGFLVFFWLHKQRIFNIAHKFLNFTANAAHNLSL